MKHVFIILLLSVAIYNCKNSKQTVENKRNEPQSPKHLYIDVHQLGAGNVTAEAVAEAHKKDLKVQGKHGVNFIEYWVNEDTGTIYCLSEASSEGKITDAHKEAHGLLPVETFLVTDGVAAQVEGDSKFFLDVHELGAGNVTAQAVADAHVKDLEVQGENKVNFVNYWIDEANGKVFCLSESPNAQAVHKTHEKAHGLLPNEIMEVEVGK
ncbi:DUF4242 domain-containing protein [Mangrovimonas sp. CR14]|uniref:DUF4242 domain-containing protein n=1 Tax=Mangrovimonas sp. CR14 TaxID=2706120 RepID=UPI001422E774|nr:DUF4242 domain-containing protein [Mangrovimonas sp. CR14]NIK92159.1 DUF4242 domain-containing protein [Mangrovimonas sp. CR14]